MANKLPVARIVNVQTVLAPIAAGRRNFGVLLVLGDTDVIDQLERFRQYASLTEVAADFAADKPEYLAAAKYFGQSPAPTLLYIGRYFSAAAPAILYGGAVPAPDNAVAAWTGIVDGSFAISVDGVAHDVTALSFAACGTMNAVAAVIDAGLTAFGASVTWDGSRFIVKTDAGGATKTLSYAVAVAPAAGTDISSKAKLRTAQAQAPIAGIVLETPLEAVQTLAALTMGWYGLVFPQADDADDVPGIAAYIEAAEPPRLFGVTTSDANALVSGVATDVGAVLKALGYEKTLCQYSSVEPYAVASIFGRMATIRFDADNSMITLKFKQQPGVVAENLTTTQANTLRTKNYNVYAAYDNDTSILQEGVVANGAFIDEILGLDWLANAIQVNEFNLLYQLGKIPQTDSGITTIMTGDIQALDQGVRNGLIGPGSWNAAGFGQLSTGDFLKSGYYIYSPPLSAQAQADREARIAPTRQIAVKLAGAVHFTNVVINVNR